MSPLDLWNFVWEQGLTGIEIGAGVLGIFLTVTGGYSIRDLLQTPRAERIFRDIAAPFGAFLGAAACLLMAYALPRERYLLRPGAGRYTVGTVADHRMRRGKRQFGYVYRVGGQRFRDEQSCGIVEWQDVCPAVGTRRYVRFSPEDPHTDQLTAVPVPDSLEHVPPLGWEQIP